MWYACQAFNPDSSGQICVQVADLLTILDRKKSTLYQWMREGLKAGAFRSYKFLSGGKLHVYLASLPQLCKKLRLCDWGFVAEISILELRDLRTVAATIATQGWQQRSCSAAKFQLKHRERKTYKICPVDLLVRSHRGVRADRSDSGSGIGNDLLGYSSLSGPSFKYGIIHQTDQRVFVSSKFIPIGASQETIGRSIGRCDRTIRRHQAKAGLIKKQIVQTKKAYAPLINSLARGRLTAAGDPDTYIRPDPAGQPGDIILHEKNGITPVSREGGHRIKVNKFFQFQGKTWIHRCNVYEERHSLRSMKFSMNKFTQNWGKVSDGVAAGGSEVFAMVA